MTDLPANAVLYLPTLVAEYRDHWPEVPYPDALAGLVEQETCITLKHKACWSPRAEFRTSRERGRGLGMFTAVKGRFDVHKELRSQFRSQLKDWTPANFYDPKLQLRALVLKMRYNFEYFQHATPLDGMAFALSAYNGGVGGVVKDKRICTARAGCDYRVWFGNVEHSSYRMRIKIAGVARSAHDINRGHVHNVLNVRRQKYQEPMSAILSSQA